MEEKIEIEWGNERLFKAQTAVTENPYDLDAWSMLIREANTRWIGEMRAFYELLVGAFPTSGRYWKMYIEQEMKARNFERVEKLFQRCLIKILYLDLWRLYLQYVKETKSKLPTYKEKMAQAYDFALEKIGLDINSYTIWQDYVAFLKSVEAQGSYAENQKITAVRKVYQRAVLTPMVNIEQIWKEYMAFEQKINPIIAEKMAMDKSKDYMNARRVAKEYEVIVRGINKHIPSIPPQGHPEELKQVDLWKKYVAWEKSNPLRSEDTTMVTKRVMFAFEQALLCLGHHADFWYESASFLQYSSTILSEKGEVNAMKVFLDEAATIYDRAISSVLSKNTLLYFAYADFEEGRHKYDKVHQVYCKYIDIPDVDPTLAYIQYMKFARRAEGIKSARNIFKRAREDARSTFQVYVAAALMEYYCSKDKNIAFRIFELGLKKFGQHPEYVECYIDYLSHLNEDNNTRVLFERVLTSDTLDPEPSVEIWNRFLEFESNIGDLTSIVKVEKRRLSVLQGIKQFEGKETAQLVDRYKFLDLYPCSPSELRSIGYFDIAKTIKKLPTAVSMAAEVSKQNTIAIPDTSQMIPYKPRKTPLPGEHIIPGGTFPMPPSVAHLCSIIPPPSKFIGPFVHVDYLIEVFNSIKLPDHLPPPTSHGDSDVKLFDLAKAVHWIEGGPPMFIKKRKKVQTNHYNEDSEDEDVVAPPENDIYRLRQLKRLK